MAVIARAPGFTRRVCLHCGLPVDGVRADGFCCSGCEAVYGLLRTEHLDAYYRLRGARGVPVADARAERRDAKWLDAVVAAVQGESGHARVTLDVQGLHCVGCVWGWMPCGLVYAALGAAVTSGSALGGAATMVAFGLGTLPTLLAVFARGYRNSR